MSSSQRWSPDLRGRVLVHGRLAIFSDSPSSAHLIRIRSPPRRNDGANPQSGGPQSVVCGEGRFSLFYGQLFFLLSFFFLLPITDCPSLG